MQQSFQRLEADQERARRDCVKRRLARLFPLGGVLHDLDELAPAFNGWKLGRLARPRAAELGDLSARAAAARAAAARAAAGKRAAATAAAASAASREESSPFGGFRGSRPPE